VLSEPRDQLFEPERSRPGGPAVQAVGESGQDVEILFDGIVGSGSLDLHHHLLPAPEAGNVGLGDRGGADGFGGKLAEDVLGRAELFLDDRVGRRLVRWSRSILQSGELGGHGSGDQMRLRGHGLAELHEEAARIFEPRAQRVSEVGASDLDVVASRTKKPLPKSDRADLHVLNLAPGLAMSSTRTMPSIANTVTKG
jgi:hypothetical protein